MDDDAELAERYGWINRAIPAASLADFVSSLAHRIASFPEAGHIAVKDRVNAIALAPIEDFRRDSDLFGEEVRKPEAQRRIRATQTNLAGTHMTSWSRSERGGQSAENPSVQFAGSMKIS